MVREMTFGVLTLAICVGVSRRESERRLWVRNGDSVWKIFLEGHNWDFPAAADVGNEAKGNSAALWNAGHMSQPRGEEETAQGQWGISESNTTTGILKKRDKTLSHAIVSASRMYNLFHDRFDD